MNPDLFMNTSGQVLSENEHNYVWLQDWAGAPGPMFYRHPAEPYSLLPLKIFLEDAHQVLGENYGPLLLSLGAMVSMLNFGGIHKEIGHFNLPVLYGPPMSGKTLTASCVALITGMSKNQISS
ncbi:uncharacterized protein LOC132745186, partial [Ruditapes philippinarum]|uniref:uncharacterized protein LOC132745186 n=1 Tax=Ruditapes philippinarum TaxID=129788 RepID=UPI00295BD125